MGLFYQAFSLAPGPAGTRGPYGLSAAGGHASLGQVKSVRQRRAGAVGDPRVIGRWVALGLALWAGSVLLCLGCASEADQGPAKRRDHHHLGRRRHPPARQARPRRSVRG